MLQSSYKGLGHFDVILVQHREIAILNWKNKWNNLKKKKIPSYLVILLVVGSNNQERLSWWTNFCTPEEGHGDIKKEKKREGKFLDQFSIHRLIIFIELHNFQ